MTPAQGLPQSGGLEGPAYLKAKYSRVKATTKRRTKSEAEMLDRATENLARALKQDMVKKNGRVDYEKLRKEGYSERLLEKFKKA